MTRAPRARPNRDFAGLDLIRFLAAVLVTVYHLTYWNWVQPGTANGRFYARAFAAAFPATSAAWVGVPVFFVLSGFVISLSAADRSPGSFVASRVLRLYPAAWLCALILAPLAVWSGDVADLPARIVRSVVLWPLGPWLSDVYWTLAIEIVFYLLVFLAMLSGSRDVGIRLAWLLALSNMAYLAARVIDRLAGGHFSDALNVFQSPAGSLFLLSRGCYFAFGIALWARSVRGWTWPIAALAACSAGTASIHLVLEDLYLVNLSGLPRWWIVGPPAIWALAVAALIHATSGNTAFDRMPPAWRRAAKLLGLMTYPLYLIHTNVGHAVMLALEYAVPPLVALLAAVAVLGVLCLAVVRAEPAVRRGLAHLLHVGYRRRTTVSQLP